MTYQNNGKYNVNIPFIDKCNPENKSIWIIVDPNDVENIVKLILKKYQI